MTKLSICIPTYNRSSCLAELLDSIVAQDVAELEVVVSDDASPDDSVAVAQGYRDRIPNLMVISQPDNLGLDRNFVEVTRAATGDYIWLMGDDDRIESGGVRRVMEALERWPDVVGLTLGVIDYDVNMQRVTGVRAMPETKVLTGAEAVFSEIAELLGFMSAMVVNRRKWEIAREDLAARSMNNLYSQVYIMGRAVGKFGNWGILKEPCVGFRSGNDQFKRSVGWLERLKIDANAYDEIANLLFANDAATRRAMRTRIFNTHIVARILNAKTNAGNPPQLLEAARFLINRYGDMRQLWTRGLPLLFAPGGVLRRLRWAYKQFSTSSGARRGRALSR